MCIVLYCIVLIIFSPGATQSVHVGEEVFNRLPYCRLKKLHKSKNVESWHKKSQLGGGKGSQINMTRMMVEYVENAPLKVTT